MSHDKNHIRSMAIAFALVTTAVLLRSLLGNDTAVEVVLDQLPQNPSGNTNSSVRDSGLRTTTEILEQAVTQPREAQPRDQEISNIATAGDSQRSHLGAALNADIDRVSYEELQQLYPSPKVAVHIGGRLDADAFVDSQRSYAAAPKHVGSAVDAQAAASFYEGSYAVEQPRHLGEPMLPAQARDDGYNNAYNAQERHLGEVLLAE